MKSERERVPRWLQFERNAVLRRAIHVTIEHPRATLATFAVVTLAALLLLPRLRLAVDGRALFARDDPAIVFQNQIDAEYGTSDFLVLGLDAPGPQGIFTPDVLASIVRLSGALEQMEGIDRRSIRSLSTIVVPRKVDGALAVAPPLQPGSLSAREAAALRSLAGDPLIGGTLVAPGGAAAAIYASVKPGVDRGRILETVRRLAAAEEHTLTRSRLTIHVAGPVSAEGELGARILRDLALFIPISILGIALLLWIPFRSGAMVFIGVAEGVAAIAWTLGLMALLGHTISLVTVVMPVILATYCVADTIHIGHRLWVKCSERPRRQAVDEMLDEILRPVIYTCLTTIAGFLSFAFTPIPPLVEFGCFTAFGVGCALIISLFVAPSLLAASTFGSPKRARPYDAGFARVIERLTLRAAAEPLLMISAFAVVTVLLALGARRLRVQDRWVDNFDAASDVARADAWFNAHFFGSNLVNVILRARNGVYDEAFLARVAGLQRELEARPEVGGALSVVDHLRAVSRALADEDRLPAGAAEAEQWELMYQSAAGSDGLAPYVRHDRAEANLWLFLNRADSQRTEVVERVIRSAAGKDADFLVGISGDAHLGRLLVGAITDGQRASILASLLIVSLLTLLMTGSIGDSLLAIVPVAVAILWNFGVMGWSGMPLGVATSTFSAIAIGVGVDLALHWMACLRLFTKAGLDWETSFRELSLRSGRAIVLNAVIVGGGFAILLLSAVPPIRRLGLVMLLNLSACCLATIILLPALVAAVGNNRVRAFAVFARRRIR